MSEDTKSTNRRRSNDSGLLLGYVPPPPGEEDPFDAPRGPGHSANAPDSDIPDEVEVTGEEPFEDEIAAPKPPLDAGTPVPAAPPRATDPRELAKRLAEEARARALASARPAIPVPEPAPPSPKRRMADRAPAPPPKAAPPPQRPVDAQSEAEPPRSAAPQAAPAEAQVPQAEQKKKRSLSDRARRPVSAAEALKLAAEAETSARKAEAAARKAELVAQSAQQEESRRARKGKTPAPEAAAPAPARPTVDAATVIRRTLPSAEVDSEIVVGNVVVVRALWTAHRARAQASKDLPLLAAASVLLDAADRVPAGCLVAARVVLDARDLAVFVDTARGAVLAIVEPADLYLAGL